METFTDSTMTADQTNEKSQQKENLKKVLTDLLTLI